MVVQVPDVWEAEAKGRIGERREALLNDLGRSIAREIRGIAQGKTLVLVVSPTPSIEMTRRGDEVGPIILVQRGAKRLFAPSGAIRALMSNTTRETGLVANVDVAPTILDFFGVPVPAEMDGQPIKVTDSAAPFHLHQLHLDQRRIRLPIQLAEVASNRFWYSLATAGKAA